jgi:hypothetical protein
VLVQFSRAVSAWCLASSDDPLDDNNTVTTQPTLLGDLFQKYIPYIFFSLRFFSFKSINKIIFLGLPEVFDEEHNVKKKICTEYISGINLVTIGTLSVVTVWSHLTYHDHEIENRSNRGEYALSLCLSLSHTHTHTFSFSVYVSVSVPVSVSVTVSVRVYECCLPAQLDVQ